MNIYDDNLERRILLPEPPRYLVAPGCRRCGGSGLRECEIEGHDMPETIESLRQRIEDLEASQRPPAYSPAPPTPPAQTSVRSVMDE